MDTSLLNVKTARFRFYEELNDFLPENRKKVAFNYEFKGNPSIKEAIESLGAPHVEVDLILVNGKSEDFTYKLREGDDVAVYPVFESLDISPLIRLRDKPLREIKFILDAHLGRLVKYLRLCGFDTLFNNRDTDREIVNIAVNEKRIILTRDREMLKNKLVTHGYWIRSQDPIEQLKEVIVRFDIKNQVCLFTRCMRCNNILEDVRKEDIIEQLKPRTRQFYDSFKRCPGCNRIYWSGSHHERMEKFVKEIISFRF